MLVLQISTAQVKVHQIPHVTFQIKGQFFFHSLDLFSVSWETILLYFSSWNFIYYWQSSTSKIKFSRLATAEIKINEIPHVSFSSKLASNVMSHNACVPFHLNRCMLWIKRSDESANFPFQQLAGRITKFLILFFKPQVSFLLNFATSFTVMRHSFSESF